jgi:RNA polymerase sigma-70 factor, ECF subfamily
MRGRERGQKVDYVDRVLVEKTKLGERNAFAELVELYKDKIFNYLYRLTGSREDAEDLAQETFLRAYAKIDTFDTALRFSPWIYRIAQNAAVDLMRKRKPLVYLDEPASSDGEGGVAWQIASDCPGPDEQVSFAYLKLEMEEALMLLPLAYRSVLLLRYTQEMSYEDMARALELPVTTVKTRLHRAREALRTSLLARGVLEH